MLCLSVMYKCHPQNRTWSIEWRKKSISFLMKKLRRSIYLVFSYEKLRKEYFQKKTNFIINKNRQREKKYLYIIHEALRLIHISKSLFLLEVDVCNIFFRRIGKPTKSFFEKTTVSIQSYMEQISEYLQHRFPVKIACQILCNQKRKTLCSTNHFQSFIEFYPILTGKAILFIQ